MNKFDMPPEQWERLQEKSKKAWGTKWRFRKIAERRAMTPDGIEALADETIEYMENIIEQIKSKQGSNSRTQRIIEETQHGKFVKSDETRSDEASDGPPSSGGDE